MNDIDAVTVSGVSGDTGTLIAEALELANKPGTIATQYEQRILRGLVAALEAHAAALAAERTRKETCMKHAGRLVEERDEARAALTAATEALERITTKLVMDGPDARAIAAAAFAAVTAKGETP